MTPPLLTAREVGDFIGYSSETVLRWTRRGQLPAIRLPGGRIRYRADALEAWLVDRELPMNDDGPAANRSEVPKSAESATDACAT